MMKEENLYTAYNITQYLIHLPLHKDFQCLSNTEQVSIASAYLSQSAYGRKLLKRNKSAIFRYLHRLAVEMFVPGFGAHLLTRKRYIEAKVRDFIECHPKGQIVNIGCGLDTLLTRLAKAGITNRLIEIDYPIVAERKRAVYQQSNLEFIGADLSQSSLADILSASSFDIHQPVFFIAEGVLMYVPEEPAFELVHQLTNMSNASVYFLFSAMLPLENDRAVSKPLKRLMKRKNTEYYWSRSMQALKKDLNEAGFSVREQKDHEAMHKKYGNPSYQPSQFHIGEYYNFAEKLLDNHIKC